MPLSHNQTILFTRQRHEAERAGLHFDYRIVVGDRAYSWATKKELPDPGNAIILWEQPVHDATYALSKKVIIPSGQYGAGITTLDWVNKGTINNPEESKDKFTIDLKDGQRFLVKKLPEKYGDKAWLFKNLTKVKEPEDIEKEASAVAMAALVHLAQNKATKAALSSKKVSKVLANSFAQGSHGVVDNSLKSRAMRAAFGATLPDLVVAHKAVYDAGKNLAPILSKATPRQKVGLRILSQGRFDDLKKYNLHKDPIIRDTHALASTRFKLPSLDHMIENASKSKHLWSDPNHPLLSNISKNISRGEKPVGKQFKKGTPTFSGPLAGAVSSSIIEPVSGMINTAKTIMGSDAIKNNKYGAKIVNKLQDTFIKKPIQSGVDRGSLSKLRDKLYESTVNPLSANLRRTSSALADNFKKNV